VSEKKVMFEGAPEDGRFLRNLERSFSRIITGRMAITYYFLPENAILPKKTSTAFAVHGSFFLYYCLSHAEVFLVIILGNGPSPRHQTKTKK